MIAFHGDDQLKTSILAELTKHVEADKLIQGYGYWQDGKGCAVGCVLESVRIVKGAKDINHQSHKLYETYLGVPIALARLEDGLFEALPKKLAQQWPMRFLNAIRPGADLSMVVPKFLHWLLTDADGPVQQQAAKRPKIKPSIDAVGALYQRWIDGAKPSDTEWREARHAAAAASAYAAYAAAAYAADAADAAAYAAAYADAAAAYADADAAADDAARALTRTRQADYLIKLLEAE